MLLYKVLRLLVILLPFVIFSHMYVIISITCNYFSHLLRLSVYANTLKGIGLDDSTNLHGPTIKALVIFICSL
jgi:hypothetical protein